MFRLLKLALVAPLVFAFSANVFADSRHSRSSYNYSSGSSSGGNSGRMAISGGLGFFGSAAEYTKDNAAGTAILSGLFGFGGDFDYFLHDDISIGGIFRYYSTTDSVGGGDVTDTLMSLGGTVKAYVFDTSHWSGNLTTGLGIVSGSVKQGNTTVDPSMTFGFYFGLQMLYKINSQVAVGVENMRMMALGSNVNGWVDDDYMFKLRYFLD